MAKETAHVYCTYGKKLVEDRVIFLKSIPWNLRKNDVLEEAKVIFKKLVSLPGLI
jgi:hypothetical protein